MKRRAIHLVLAVLVPVLFVSWCSKRDERLESQFLKLSPGMSHDEVIAIMGEPDWDDRCGARLPTGLPKPCTRELGYPVTLAPWTPQYYLVWFGADQHVVETAPITSP